MTKRRVAYGRAGIGAALMGLMLATSAPGAHATEGSDAEHWRDVVRFDVKTPYASMNAGAARANVDAPAPIVRQVVLDYKNYASFITRFEKARVVGRSGDKTDVYLQVPILKGAAKVWSVVRFEPPKRVGDEEVVMGHMLKGNVKRLDAIWRIRKIDETSTRLTLELLIVPDLPVPDALVVPEVRFAAAKALSGTRDEAEKRAARVAEQP